MAPVAGSGARAVRRAMFPLGLLFFATGIAVALVSPFLSLFLSTAVRAGPVRVIVFLFVAPLSGVLAATLIGRLSDRRPVRRALLIGAAVAGVLGAGFTAFVRDYWVLLGLAVTMTAAAGSLFPQSFAYARQVLSAAGSGRAAMGISSLRTVFSFAWVTGPPLAAALLSWGGFDYLYGTAAVMYALAALVALTALREVAAPVPAAPVPAVPGPAVPGPEQPSAAAQPATGPPPASRWTLLPSAAAFTMLQCPLTLAVQALPLFIERDLGGRATDAGPILGLCAALEIPLMLGFGVLAARIGVRALLLAGAGCGVAYYTLATAAPAIWVLAVGQVVDAAFIAAVSGLGISYMQDMLPDSPGRATTLFTNSFPVGAMLAGPLFGLAERFGLRLAYGMSAALCACGLLALLAVRPPGRPSGDPAAGPSPAAGSAPVGERAGRYGERPPLLPDR
ncbi:sugar efflux transporter [Rugosimonospora acidiphila]|uniref:Sugar efflux transporter n=1 Tax=Rugosimonospora acidiphila TaxID=556531 RepID=A0ABP9S179_9ACTN